MVSRFPPERCGVKFRGGKGGFKDHCNGLVSRQRFVARTKEVADGKAHDAEQKQTACRLDAKGLSHKAIARDLNFSLQAIEVTLLGDYRRNHPGDEWTPAPGRLSAEEREEILVGLSRGESMSSIARGLGRAPSTVTREVAANGGPGHYGAWKGRCRAQAASLRPKAAKLDHPALVRQVTTWLKDFGHPKKSPCACASCSRTIR